MAKFAFCHGWYLDANFCEVTCKRRERCAYYDVDFYRKHGHHLYEFEELFPHEPCEWFMERTTNVKKEEIDKTDIFSLLNA